MSDQTALVGDTSKAIAYVEPARAGSQVFLQIKSRSTGQWINAASAATNARGRASFTVTFHAIGTDTIRMVARAAASSPPKASTTWTVSVHSPQLYKGDTTGPDLLVLRRELCLGIADALEGFAPLGGPLYAAAVTFAGSAYRESNCNNASFARSIWIAAGDSLQELATGWILDKVSGTWDPVIEKVFSRVHADAIGLDYVGKNLFNSWILQDIQQVVAAFVACAEATVFPHKECPPYAPTENALLAMMLK